MPMPVTYSYQRDMRPQSDLFRGTLPPPPSHGNGRCVYGILRIPNVNYAHEPSQVTERIPMNAQSDDDFVLRADCPSRPILDQIADKWSLLVMAVLRRPHRFNAIKRRLEGITQRVLAQTLRRLERNGLVARTVVAGRVLAVEYSLTPLGRSLEEPVMSLYVWTVNNMEEVQDRRRAYDARDLGSA